METKQHVDIAIVGGGLVGLVLARALEASGLSLALIDQGQPPTPIDRVAPQRDGATLKGGFEPRVSSFNPASKALLERVGAWPDDDRICAFTRMLVWDGRGTGRIEFDASMIGEPAIGYIVENRHILAALIAGARDQDNLALHYSSPIDGIEKQSECYEISLRDKQTLAADLLIGADGGNSIVREACGIRSLKWEYGQDALVATIETERPHDFCARQCFTAEGPLALLPLPSEGQNLCSIVWSTAHAQKWMAMDDGEICDRLTRESEQVLGKVLGIDRRYTFALRQNHALRYVASHLALAGDAAHTLHPLAGQGANLGLADAQALAVILTDCRALALRPSTQKLLRRYERQRQPQNVVAAGVMEVFKRLYGTDHPAVNFLRNTGTRWVDDNRFVKGMIMRLAAGR